MTDFPNEGFLIQYRNFLSMNSVRGNFPKRASETNVNFRLTSQQNSYNFMTHTINLHFEDDILTNGAAGIVLNLKENTE